MSARRKGLRGRLDKEMRRRKGCEQELKRQSRTLPLVQIGQECRMRGTGENIEVGWCGVLLHRRVST